jgi:hypothetical protein
MSDRVAELAPRGYLKQPRSVEELLDDLRQRLQSEFCMAELGPYFVVTEGWTDLKYLLHAAALAKEMTGIDLLRAVLPDGNDVAIELITPGKDGDPRRGGVAQMVRLAEAIAPACFQYEAYYGVAFVFDHDEAGLRAREEIQHLGFKEDLHLLTLDPRHHAGACAKKQVVVEDLLSLEVQTAFFELGHAWCSCEFEDGIVRRYVWRAQSKAELLEFVITHSSASDLRELVRALVRIRSMWGLPVDPDLADRLMA